MKNNLNIVQFVARPLFSVFIFMLAVQSMAIYLTLMLTLEDHSQFSIGVMNALGYVGFFASGFYTDRLIHRLGHRKTFVLCSLLAALLSLLFFLGGNYFWILCLRFVLGWAVGLFYIVIESWMLVAPPRVNQGQYLAFYTIVLNCAQMLSPFLLDIMFTPSHKIFVLAGLLCLLSILPLLFYNPKNNSMDQESMIECNVYALFKRVPVAFLGCILSGIITSSYSSLVPYYALKEGYAVSTLMSLFVLGGALFQWPIGYCGDVFGRLCILTYLSCAMLISTSILLVADHNVLFRVGIFMSGAFTFSLYPISIGLASESFENNEIVTASKALLLAYSIGSIVGILVIGWFMTFFAMNKLLFILTGMIAGTFGFYLFSVSFLDNPS
jgi:MFS family permease